RSIAVPISLASFSTTLRTFSNRVPDIPKVNASMNPDNPNNTLSNEFSPPLGSPFSSLPHFILAHLPIITIMTMTTKRIMVIVRASVLCINEYTFRSFSIFKFLKKLCLHYLKINFPFFSFLSSHHRNHQDRQMAE